MPPMMEGPPGPPPMHFGDVGGGPPPEIIYVEDGHGGPHGDIHPTPSHPAHWGHGMADSDGYDADGAAGADASGYYDDDS
jgi:hypothetical protein